MNLNTSKGTSARCLWIFAALVLAICAGARAQMPQMSEVMVTDAWANPPLVPQNNMAVYLTIENPTDTARSVVSVSTDDAAGAELHQMQMNGKMMMMTPIPSLEVPAKGSVQLKPGGYHIMLTGVKKPLKPGDEMKIALKLDNGKSIPVTVKVRAADASPDGAGGMVMPPVQK